MNPHVRLTPRPALHQNCVDFPVSANTAHCIKTAWFFRHCGIASLHHCTKTAWNFRAAPTNSTTYKLWQTRKKPRGPEDIRKETRSFTGTHPTAFGLLLHVKQRDCTHHRTAVIIIGSSTAGLWPEDVDIDITNPHRAVFPAIRRSNSNG
jgi:hypothetical protein